MSMRCVLRYQMEAVAKIWGGCTVEKVGRKVYPCRLNVEQSSHQKKKKPLRRMADVSSLLSFAVSSLLSYAVSTLLSYAVG